MSSATGMKHAGCRLNPRGPLISTRHIRHMPTGFMRGCQQKRGMYMPWRSAAAITSSPCRASMARPSTVTVTVSFCCSVCWLISPEGTAALLDVDEELVPEHAHGRGDRRGDGGAEHADRGLLGRPGQTRGDVVAHVEEEVEVLLPAGAVLDAAHD